MKRWSLKVKVGVYAALLTMVALGAGSAVLMPTLYFHQIRQCKLIDLHRHQW